VRSPILRAAMFLVLTYCATVLAQIDVSSTLLELQKRHTSGPSVDAGSPSLPSGYSMQSLRESRASTVPTEQSTIFDKPIDPATYVLGPGDELLVYMIGTDEKSYHILVNSEGSAIVPTVGEIHLGDSTLAAARTLIETALKRINKNVTISVTVASVRLFKTYVSGAVAKPGSYVIDGVTRVSDLVEVADGGRIGDSNRRGVQILNDTGIAAQVDLAAFYHSGRLDQNPYVGQGQRVYVRPRTEYVTIAGELNYVGTYDFMSGDSLGSILVAAGGLGRNADSTRVRITRFADNGDSLTDFEISLPEARAFLLQKDDRIQVLAIPHYREMRNVTVRGEVKYPGVYPIRNDKTRLKDMIRMAGGLTEDAFLEGSYLLRNRKLSIPGKKTSPERMMQIIDATRVSSDNIDPSEMSYLKSEFLETEGKMAVDFAKALKDGDNTNDILLREDDEIVIARQTLTVRVMGSVVTPGLVSQSNGKDVDYYISQAGGFNTRARKHAVLVKKVGTDVWITPARAESIDPGDIILVPEKKYRDAFIFTRDVLGIVSSLATIVIAGITISNALAP